MSVHSFWKKIISDLNKGKTFLTLYQSENFSANTYYNEIVIIPYKSRKIRYIKKNEFERVWKHGLTLDEKKKFRPTNYLKIGKRHVVNASYILTLVDFYLRKFNEDWE